MITKKKMFFGKPEYICHECGINDIYINMKGDWVMDINGGEYQEHIKYCPYCGVELNALYTR